MSGNKNKEGEESSDDESVDLLASSDDESSNITSPRAETGGDGHAGTGGGDSGGTGGGSGGDGGGFCLRCGQSYHNCARHKHGQALTAFAANILAARPTLSKNKKRRLLYRHLQENVMGRPEDYANGVAVPHCIRDKAREMYPDNSNGYLVKDNMDYVPNIQEIN